MSFRKFIFMPIPIRDGRQEQWKPTSPPFFFFSPLQFSYENSETFSAVYYVCPVSICRIMNAKKKKKNSKFESEDMRQWIFFFFHYIFPMNTQKDFLLSFFSFVFSPVFRLREIISSQDKFFAVPFLCGT